MIAIDFGIRYSFVYNYKVVHHTPQFSMNIGQHNIYLGPQFTQVLHSLGDPVDVYSKNTYGGNVGYRFHFWKRKSKLVPFAQLDFSIFQLKFNENQLGPPFLTERKKIVVENTASIGVDFNPVHHFYIFSGIGFGSYSGFFLLFNSFTPTCYVGLEYRF